MLQNTIDVNNDRQVMLGCLGRQPLEHTLSPSMDITVSSNFERLLFDMYDRDGAAIADLMARFDEGDIAFSDAAMAQARQLFAGQRTGLRFRGGRGLPVSIRGAGIR